MPCNSQLTCVAVSLLIAVPALADDTISAPVEGLTRVLEGEWFGDQPWEPDGLASVVHVDNDIFFPGTSDADYTAGLGLSLIGPETRTSPFSLVPAVEYLDRLLPGGPAVTGNEAPGARYAMQLGTLGFTPDDLSSSEPLPDDRPYASLLLLSGARQWKEPLEPVAHRSTLTVGFLGLNVFSFFQKTWHGITDTTPPQGWQNQISNGGEPTFRYIRSRHRLILSRMDVSARTLQLSWTGETSLGYLTESSVALSARWGRLRTAWWSFTPEQTDYMARPLADDHRGGPSGWFLFGGVKLRGRVFNAFLQGQFRNSAVTYSFDELKHVIGEAWLGAQTGLGKNTVLTYTLRYQSQEIRHGKGARAFGWGTLEVQRRF